MFRCFTFVFTFLENSFTSTLPEKRRAGDALNPANGCVALRSLDTVTCGPSRVTSSCRKRLAAETSDRQTLVYVKLFRTTTPHTSPDIIHPRGHKRKDLSVSVVVRFLSFSFFSPPLAGNANKCVTDSRWCDAKSVIF